MTGWPVRQHALERHVVAAHGLAVLAQHLPARPGRFGQGRVGATRAPAEEAARRAVDARERVVGPEHHHPGTEVLDQRARVRLADQQALARAIAFEPQPVGHQGPIEHHAQQAREQEEEHRDRPHLRQRQARHRPGQGEQQHGDELHRGQQLEGLHLGHAPLRVGAHHVPVRHAHDDEHRQREHGLARLRQVPHEDEHGLQRGRHQAGRGHPRHRLQELQVAAKAHPGQQGRDAEGRVADAVGEEVGHAATQPQAQRPQDGHRGRQRPPARPPDGRVAAQQAKKCQGREPIDADPHREQGGHVKQHGNGKRRTCRRLKHRAFAA
ncbi:hypothetical protein ACFJI0_26660 [Hydrogenophaga sp. UC242_53]|uniref:hypothetical protein n=1 Tax=Hydrogenophaga sp. UC242_53 TaxID=3350170 RepID=UPI0036D43D8A